jgi:hypothetical protein
MKTMKLIFLGSLLCIAIVGMMENHKNCTGKNIKHKSRLTAAQ